MPEIAGVDRKWWIVGGVATVGIVYWSYKKSKQASATADTSSGDAIDPNTGIPYSQETTYAPGDFGSGYGGGSYGTAAPIVGTTVLPTTKAEWAREAESYLTGIGYDALTVGAAIGKYLSG